MDHAYAIDSVRFMGGEIQNPRPDVALSPGAARLASWMAKPVPVPGICRWSP